MFLGVGVRSVEGWEWSALADGGVWPTVDLQEDAILRASPLAAQDLRSLPVPGGEHGRAG